MSSILLVPDWRVECVSGSACLVFHTALAKFGDL